VVPPAARAARCAAASTPRAQPETTVRPAAARARPKWSGGFATVGVGPSGTDDGDERPTCSAGGQLSLDVEHRGRHREVEQRGRVVDVEEGDQAGSEPGGARRRSAAARRRAEAHLRDPPHRPSDRGGQQRPFRLRVVTGRIGGEARHQGIAVDLAAFRRRQRGEAEATGRGPPDLCGRVHRDQQVGQRGRSPVGELLRDGDRQRHRVRERESGRGFAPLPRERRLAGLWSTAADDVSSSLRSSSPARAPTAGRRGYTAEV
jgi:hypothetical protein